MKVLNLVEKALNIRAFYHGVLSGNIANVETPNYKEKDINFQAELQRQLTSTRDIEVHERKDYDGVSSLDGNTVNIEGQIVKMSENNLIFNSLVQVVTKKFSMMRYVINEGKR